MRAGRLASGGAAPVDGESTDVLASGDGFRVEQILSGQVDTPVEYLQEHDEWVLVVAGAAVLEVDGERVELAAGGWVELPGGRPHRLLSVVPGTSWVAVHAGPGGI
ncbi:MAG: cupin domain-containing protein [Acidimicrobiia bacterium]|nr:cupin domain-containing protein [Acidimicrobiia bacterium]